MNRMLSRKRTILIFMLPSILLFLVIQILPIFMSSYYSLFDWDGMADKVFVGFQNYVQLFTSNRIGFLKALLNSLKYAACSLAIQLPIALFIALILTNAVKNKKIKAALMSVYFIPVIISTSVTGQLFCRIYNIDYGILNRFLAAIGLDNLTAKWLADPKLALYCVFVPMIWQFVGYHMLLMYSSMQSISPEIIEASLIDGAGFWTRSFKITVPLIKPTIRICLILALTSALKMFDLVNIMTDGGPVRSTEVPATLMVRQIFTQHHYGLGSAIAIWIIIECFVASIIIRKTFKVKEI